MNGFRSTPSVKNSRREWQRRAATQNEINQKIGKEYADLEKRHNEALKDIKLALEACDAYIAWPMVPRKVKKILHKYLA